MLKLQKYQNKKVAVYGMGITGLSAARTLKKLGAKVICWDDNKRIRNKFNPNGCYSNDYDHHRTRNDSFYKWKSKCSS